MQGVPSPSHIHHINVLVRDLKHSVARFEKLLNQNATIQALPQREVETATFRLGDSYLVLVCPSHVHSVVGKILAEKGPGLFLLSLSVNDLDSTIERLQAQAIAQPSSPPRKGIDNWSIQDIEFTENADDELGFILQLCADPNAP